MKKTLFKALNGNALRGTVAGSSGSEGAHAPKRWSALSRAAMLVAVALLGVGGANAATHTVTSGGDTQAGTVDEPVEPIAGSLRAAVLAAEDGDVIDIKVATITLIAQLDIRRSITIKGNGNVITAAGVLILFDNPPTATTSDPAKVITVERVHFKNMTHDAHPIINRIDLTLKACIFSGNESAHGALLSQSSFSAEGRGYPSTLSLYGCTFINNVGGETTGTFVVQVLPEPGDGVDSREPKITLVGNIFNGAYPTGSFLSIASSDITTSYNVTGDDYDRDGILIAATDSLLVDSLVSAATFVPLVTTLPTLPDPLPAGYPTVDFYGTAIVPGSSIVGAVTTTEVPEPVPDEPDPVEPDPNDPISAVFGATLSPLAVYPSITSGLVYVENAEGAEVAAYTLGGAVVVRARAGAIDLSGQPAGVYIIRVGAKAAKVVKK
jgi:hypothetical protein